MKFLFMKLVVLYFLLFTISSCAPGRLGTIDQYLPELTETDDESYTTTPTESDEETDDYTWYYHADNITDATQSDITLKNLVAYIERIAGQDDTTKGHYVYTDKAGRSVTIVYVAGPSSSLAAYVDAK
ncbi:uncharacterized protein LOC114119936 isoform X2 [Aphis gossypii]|uniref:uncharacterized protein LOC114119936 isoform X2 n=1 Tax=Aphis gossypii TaxID=80765 RepID=UPI002159853A|nr:uncharacterized protein LOC114119936 isoform X2 [Aphis gossypii]